MGTKSGKALYVDINPGGEGTEDANIKDKSRF
jgi:hypothetical protein